MTPPPTGWRLLADGATEEAMAQEMEQSRKELAGGLNFTASHPAI